MNRPLFTSCVFFATNFMTSCCTVFSETWEEIKDETFHFCFSACTHACKELTPLPHFICSDTISFFVSYKGNHLWRPTVSFKPFNLLVKMKLLTLVWACYCTDTHKLSRQSLHRTSPTANNTSRWFVASVFRWGSFSIYYERNVFIITLILWSLLLLIGFLCQFWYSF